MPLEASRPLVSVVTSVYNGERYLAASLCSVLGQAGVPFELIVVDDGSTDATPAILQQFAVDPRMRVLRQENGGLTKALVRGCAEARGRYIARHDADDLSFPGRLAAQAARLEQDPGLAVVSCWSQVIGPANELLYERRRPAAMAEPLAYRDHSSTGPLGHGSAMFPADLYHRVGGYRPAFYYAQDIDLWLRLCDRGLIAFVPRFLYAFRMAENSISTLNNATQAGIEQLAYACREARRQGGDESPYLEQAATRRPGGAGQGRGRRADGNYFIGKCLLKRRDPRARVYLKRSLRQNPWQCRSWAALAAATLLCRSQPPRPFLE